MKVRQEQIGLWRDALGDDAEAIWNSIREDVAPPLRRSFKAGDRLRPQRWLLAAAAVLVIATGTWNFVLMRQLTDIRGDYLAIALTADSSATRLATLHRLEGESLSADAVEALKELVRISQDPNIQLAALDLLLDSRALSRDSEIQALLEQVRHNSRFIRAAVRSRSIRT